MGSSRGFLPDIRPARVEGAPGSLIGYGGAGSDMGWLLDMAGAAGAAGYPFGGIGVSGRWLGGTEDDGGAWPAKHTVDRLGHAALPGCRIRGSRPDARERRFGALLNDPWRGLPLHLAVEARGSTSRAGPGGSWTGSPDLDRRGASLEEARWPGTSKTACSNGDGHRFSAHRARRPCAWRVLRSDRGRSCCSRDKWAGRAGPPREENRVCADSPHHDPPVRLVSVAKQLRTDWVEPSEVLRDRTLRPIGPLVLGPGSLSTRLVSASPPTYAVRRIAVALADRKVVDEVIEALAPLQRSGADPHLLISGRARCEPVQGTVSGLGLERSTTFLGWVPRDRLPEFSGSVDRSVSISRPDSWDVAEADVMASAVPVTSVQIVDAKVQNCSPESELLVVAGAVHGRDTRLRVSVGDTNLGGAEAAPGRWARASAHPEVAIKSSQ